MRTTIRMWALGACALAAGWTAEAMPTRAEFQKMLPVVRELSADDTAAVRAGKMTPAEAGDNALRRAEDPSMDEASRYLFFEAAFAHYVKAAEYDKAADLVGKLRASISEVPDTAIVELIERNMKGVTRQEAQRLHALWRKARLAEKYARRLDEYRKSVKDAPADKTARLRLAVALVLMGDWEGAQEHFAQCGGAVADIVKQERKLVQSSVRSARSEGEIAEFWWKYVVADAQFLDDRAALGEVFKTHAGMWYQAALADGAYEGSQKLLIEKRLSGLGSEVPRLTLPETSMEGKDFRVVLGADGAIKIEIGKGECLEFVKCPAGMYSTEKIPLFGGKPHKIKITRPFWMAKYPVTLGQLEALEHSNRVEDTTRKHLKLDEIEPDSAKRSKLVEDLGVRRFRFVFGTVEEAVLLRKMEEIRSFLRTIVSDDYVVRYPTEAEWCYAASAGGKDLRGLIGWTQASAKPEEMSKWCWPENGRGDLRKTLFEQYPALKNKGVPVGGKLANKWGLYDFFMDSFRAELLLDTGVRRGQYELERFTYEDVEIDPIHRETQEGRAILYLKLGCVAPGFRPYRAYEGEKSRWFSPRLVIAPDVKLLNVYPKKK